MTKRRLPFIKADETLNRVQKEVSGLFDFLQLSPLVGPVSVIENITLTTSPAAIEHKLQRQPLGFIVVNQNANANVWSSSTMTPVLANLVASSNVTVTLLFF
jgi:hypothetical protein